MSPEVYGGPDPEIDLYAFAGFTPEVPPDAPAIYFGVEARPWLPAARGRAEDPEITSWDRDHPVLRDVSLRDLRIEEAPILEPDGWTVLAASGETPLLLAGDTPSRSIVVGFRLERSDVAFHLGFPIFVGNAVEWLSGDSLAQATELGAITVPERADTLIRLDGSAVRFTYEFGQTLFEAVSPDFFTMGVEGRRVRIAASLRSRANSDVNRGSGTVGSPPVSATGRELWRWMLGAAALLAALEWWTYQRRMTL
jgi:hypothetical protein